ncbi:unnamed protein product [Cylicostephanus goldi]|uniref:Uncharacterized protein n=1 Tax=Cylicostephanus goldi TaxID=71465 RepID=A0A3P6RVS2_CYLGO|nr:unnamed protein product [Cylicostephanus goldi]
MLRSLWTASSKAHQNCWNLVTSPSEHGNVNFSKWIAEDVPIAAQRPTVGLLPVDVWRCPCQGDFLAEARHNPCRIHTVILADGIGELLNPEGMKLFAIRFLSVLQSAKERFGVGLMLTTAYFSSNLLYASWSVGELDVVM